MCTTARPELRHGRETAVWGDAAYAGQGHVIAQHAPWAQDFAQHRGRADKYLSQMQRQPNRHRSKIRSRVEHLVGVIKRIVGFAKVRRRQESGLIGLFSAGCSRSACGALWAAP
jgi:IS5 family transposase